MYLIHITGAPASGKTTLANLFKNFIIFEKHNLPKTDQFITAIAKKENMIFVDFADENIFVIAKNAGYTVLKVRMER